MAETQRASGAKRHTRLRWIGSLVALGLFAWLLARQDWAAVAAQLRVIPLWVLPTALALFVSGMFANALRWYRLLRVQGVAMRFYDIFKIVMAGAFASNFLPSTIGGDTLRILVMQRNTQNWTASLGSVVTDRLMNVVAMATALPCAYVVLFQPVSSGHWPALLYGMGLLTVQRQLRQVLGRVWGVLHRRGSELLQFWRQHPLALAESLLISWFSVGVIFLGVWVVAQGIAIHVSLPEVIGVSALVYFFSLLPIAVNGYGLREVTMTMFYIHLGATLEQASTLALLTRFLMLLETLPGAWWLPRLLTSASAPSAAPPPAAD